MGIVDNHQDTARRKRAVNKLLRDTQYVGGAAGCHHLHDQINAAPEQINQNHTGHKVAQYLNDEPQPLGHGVHNNFDSNMAACTKCRAGAEKHDPNNQAELHLLLPGQRVVEQIAHDNADKCHQHQQDKRRAAQDKIQIQKTLQQPAFVFHLFSSFQIEGA